MKHFESYRDALSLSGNGFGKLCELSGNGNAYNQYITGKRTIGLVTFFRIAATLGWPKEMVLSILMEVYDEVQKEGLRRPVGSHIRHDPESIDGRKGRQES